MALAARVTVYDGNIVRLIQVGDGKRWIKRTAEKIEGTARLIAPRRTGALVKSHRVQQERGPGGRFATGFSISANTYYARWVHEGTGLFGPKRGYIYPRRGRAMVIPAHRLKFPPAPRRKGGEAPTRLVVKRTRGQQAKPWLQTAADTVIGFL